MSPRGWTDAEYAAGVRLGYRDGFLDELARVREDGERATRRMEEMVEEMYALRRQRRARARATNTNTGDSTDSSSEVMMEKVLVEEEVELSDSPSGGRRPQVVTAWRGTPGRGEQPEEATPHSRMTTASRTRTPHG